MSALDLAMQSGNERALIFAVNKAAPFLSEEARLHAFKRWQSLVQDELVVERFGEEELLRPSLGLKFVEFTELVKSKKGARCNVK